MRRRRKKRLLAALLCLPLFAATFAALSSLSPGSALRTAVLAGSFLAAPKSAVQAAGKVLHIEDDAVTEEAPGGGFWTEAAPGQPASSAASTASAPPPSTGEKPDGAGSVVDAVYTGQEDDVTVACGAGLVKNCTELSRTEVLDALGAALPFALEKNSPDVQVLVMHTHATESYQNQDGDWYDPAESSRTTDTSRNMVAVGQALTDTLNAAGIVTVHDGTLHDYPSYNGSYERSRATVENYLAQYPTIKVVLDIHRDAIEKDDGTRMRPVVAVNGERCAQLMIICGADNGNMNMPNYKQNLRFAGALQDSLATLAPTLARPVLFDYRSYNQNLTTGSLLVEVGGHANTLPQALASARLLGQALAALAQ